ncbi:uncharacterized protein LOC113121978 [Mastacembelus armatus]|uniref:uncharacterized protein LOC113121978 n=1 Tax=Mastacembelus armatus TaxID=205130 RepID=UPI000E45B2A2|nr:uncharacterized protein LOC113121978 [Mastacembelus armatus]
MNDFMNVYPAVSNFKPHNPYRPRRGSKWSHWEAHQNNTLHLSEQASKERSLSQTSRGRPHGSKHCQSTSGRMKSSKQVMSLASEQGRKGNFCQRKRGNPRSWEKSAGNSYNPPSHSPPHQPSHSFELELACFPPLPSASTAIATVPEVNGNVKVPGTSSSPCESVPEISQDPQPVSQQSMKESVETTSEAKPAQLTHESDTDSKKPSYAEVCQRTLSSELAPRADHTPEPKNILNMSKPFTQDELCYQEDQIGSTNYSDQQNLGLALNSEPTI